MELTQTITRWSCMGVVMCCLLELPTAVPSMEPNLTVGRGEGNEETSMAKCKSTWSLLDNAMQPSEHKLVLLPDSGWGDLVHSLVTAVITSAVHRRQFHVYPTATDNGRCLPEMVTMVDRQQRNWSIGDAILQKQMPLWWLPKVMVPALTWHSALWWEEHGSQWVLEGKKGCVYFKSIWAGGQAVFPNCTWVFVNGHWNNRTLVRGLARSLNVTDSTVITCALRFLLQFHPRLVNRTEEHLSALGITDRTKIVGIHVRAMRYLKGLRPELRLLTVFCIWGCVCAS